MFITINTYAALALPRLTVDTTSQLWPCSSKIVELNELTCGKWLDRKISSNTPRMYSFEKRLLLRLF